MTPAQYEARCAEMLKANAHNMTPDEIERFAWGTSDRATKVLAGCERQHVVDARAQDLEDAIRSAISTLEFAL